MGLLKFLHVYYIKTTPVCCGCVFRPVARRGIEISIAFTVNSIDCGLYLRLLSIPTAKHVSLCLGGTSLQPWHSLKKYTRDGLARHLYNSVQSWHQLPLAFVSASLLLRVGCCHQGQLISAANLPGYYNNWVATARRACAQATRSRCLN